MRFVSLAMVGMLALATGCSQQALPPSGPHAMTTPEKIELYQTEPPHYELLGQITLPATPEMRWDEHGDAAAGFEALKAKASGMGANGILLMQKNGHYDYLVGARYQEKFYQVPMKYQPRSVLVDAIWVPPNQ